MPNRGRQAGSEPQSSLRGTRRSYGCSIILFKLPRAAMPQPGRGQKIRRGLESAIRNVSGRWEMMFALPDRKPIAEFNVYRFLMRQQFKNGRVVFQSFTEMREVSADLSATANDARKSLEEFRKQLLETVNLTTGPRTLKNHGLTPRSQ